MLLFRFLAKRWDLRESSNRQELNLVHSEEQEILKKLLATYDVVLNVKQF